MKCGNCIPLPNFGQRFEEAQHACSGHCEPCLDCMDRAKYFTSGMPRCLGIWAVCPMQQPKPPLTAFETVVGVSLEDWMAADTSEKLAELLYWRDVKEGERDGPLRTNPAQA